MSSFWGYLFEGTVFLSLWLWWMGHTFVGAIKCQSESKTYTPRLSYPLPGTKIPIEIFFKLAVSFAGFSITLLDDGIAWVDDEGNYRKMATVITMSIYGIFLLHSLVELMMWYGFPWIRDSHYLTAALGCLWYSLATYYRAQDFMHHAPVAVMVKTFPMYPMLAIGVSLLVEAERKSGYWTQMVRIICTGLLATWNWNAAFILHVHGSTFPGHEPSDWDMAEHDNAAFIGAAFGDHLCLHLIFLCVVYFATSVYLRLRHGIRVKSLDMD